MIVKMEEKTMSLPTAIALVALVAGGFTAWSNVKSDVRANKENVENSKEAEKRIEKKVDRIYDYLINKDKESA